MTSTHQDTVLDNQFSNNPDDKIATRKAVEDYLIKELAFRTEVIEEMGIANKE